MHIFIRCIPDAVSEQDLREFAVRTLCSFWRRLFGRWKVVESVQILRIIDQREKMVEYHGLVELGPNQNPGVAIRRFRHAKLNGKPVMAWKYRQRSVTRDHRHQRSEVGLLAIHDRRRGDRRRADLVVDVVSMSGDGYSASMLPIPASTSILF